MPVTPCRREYIGCGSRCRERDGICDFDHTKYYRLYAAPTTNNTGEAAMAQAYIMGQNFYPGRQIMKFHYLKADWMQPHLSGIASIATGALRPTPPGICCARDGCSR